MQDSVVEERENQDNMGGGMEERDRAPLDYDAGAPDYRQSPARSDRSQEGGRRGRGGSSERPPSRDRRGDSRERRGASDRGKH